MSERKAVTRPKRWRSAITGLFTRKPKTKAEHETTVGEAVTPQGRQLSSAERRTAHVVAAQAYHQAESMFRVVGVVRIGTQYVGEAEADGVKVRVRIEVSP